MIGAIVLAAGESQRMGTQKLLLPFAGKTVIEHIATQIIASTTSETLIVTGHQSDRVAAVLSDYPVRIIHNPAYKQGMLSTIRAGLRAAPPAWTGILVILGDQPALQTHVIDALNARFTQHLNGILVPVFNKRRGHPLLFASQYKAEVLTRFDQEGLRGLLHAHPQRIHEIPVPTDTILHDIDYPEDYERELQALRKRTETR